MKIRWTRTVLAAMGVLLVNAVPRRTTNCDIRVWNNGSPRSKRKWPPSKACSAASYMDEDRCPGWRRIRLVV